MCGRCSLRGISYKPQYNVAHKLAAPYGSPHLHDINTTHRCASTSHLVTIQGWLMKMVTRVPTMQLLQIIRLNGRYTDIDTI